MEKIIGEDEIRGLEEEIDSAVERLFVDRKADRTESPSVKPHPAPPPQRAKKADSEIPVHPPSGPASPLQSFDKMETRLLSLEWEITGEDLEKTKEEIQGLREAFRERPDIISVLNLMAKVIIHMTQNEEGIQPSQIKFLMDSKETIKLLMKEDAGAEFSVYKQLALSGIEARYLALEGIKQAQTKPPASGPGELTQREASKPRDKQFERMFNKMDLLFEKMSDLLKRFEGHLSTSEEKSRALSKPEVRRGPVPVDITLFKAGERLFGIESQKVFKLFKVPDSFDERYSGQHKIRMKDFEIRMVDLKGILSIQSRGRKGERQLLTVKEDGEYKGLVVDQMVKRLTTEVDTEGDYGEYFSGVVHWTYQEVPLEIPVLNLKRI
ncbi:MAG: hypothetical protein HXY46_03570 [Syntrophaceae bacterium]|nr:hypothetical protein [Syntrophaceae bacterium]